LSDGDIKEINCGFIYPDGSFYGTDEYTRGNWTHEKILYHYDIKEEPGVIRFCSAFIVFESTKRFRNIRIDEKYNISCITKEQSEVLRKWLSAQKGKINCPTCFSKEYQVRYLETLDDRLLTNIIIL
jgi:hypothetical protein